MPMYDFKCECGNTQSEFRGVAQWNDPMVCSVCGQVMSHDLIAQQPAVRGDYKTPIISDSMGFVADKADVDEHRKRYPNIDLDIDNGCARPVFRNMGQKRGYMKSMGWEDKRAYV